MTQDGCLNEGKPTIYYRLMGTVLQRLQHLETMLVYRGNAGMFFGNIYKQIAQELRHVAAAWHACRRNAQEVSTQRLHTAVIVALV